MTATIGRNILVQFLEDRNRSLRVAAESKARAHLVMDDLSFAVELKRLSPQSTIIHRSYHPDDAEFHIKWTPQQFKDTYLKNVPAGIVIVVGNEPHGYVNLRELADFYSALADICPANVTLAFPAFGMGHPTETVSDLDKLWLIFKKYPRHILLVHEYANLDPAQEQGYHIGRYRAIWNRMRHPDLKVPIPRTIVGEYGRDKGGGRRDGWHGLSWSPDHFWKFLKAGLELVYNPDGVDVIVFCEGKGAHKMWESFNIEGYLEDEFRVWNEEHPMSQKPKWEDHNWGARINNVTTSMTSVNNVRELPSATAALSAPQLKNGDLLDAYYDTPFNDGTYRWYKIVRGGRDLYTTNLSNLVFKPVVVVPPPVIDNGNVLLPVTKLNEILAATERWGQLAEGVKADIAEMDTLRTEIVKRFSGLLKG